MRKHLLSHFNLIQRLKESKNVLSGIVVSMSMLSSPQLFGQTCVAPVVPPTTICAGNLAQLTPTNSNPAGTTYEWYSASTGGTLLFTGDIYTPQLSSNTTFYVASKKIGTICPTTRTAVTVTVNPAPITTLTVSPASICGSGDVTLSGGSTGIDFITQINPPNAIYNGGGGSMSGFSEYYTVSTSGSFSRTAITAAGCTKTVTASLTVAPALATPTMTAVTSVCQGVSLPLTPSMAGGTWTISPATGATISANAFTGTTTGVYAVTYTVSNAGCSKSVTSNITVNALPVATLTVTPATVCAGSQVILNGGSTGNSYVTSTNPANAVYNNGAGSMSSFSEYYTVSTSGQFLRTTKTAAGCTKTVTANVTVNPLPVPTITVAKTGICKDETLPLGGSTNVGTGVWSISTSPLPALSGGATTNSTINSVGLFTGNNPGIFKTRYTATQTLNGITCSAFSEKEITVGALPFTITGPTNVCQNTQYTYTPQQIQVGGAGNSLYKWDVYQTGTANPPISVYQAGMTGYNAVNGSAILDVKGESPKNITLTAEGRFYCIPGNTLAYRNQSASINVTIVPNPTGIRLKCADATCNTLTAVMKDNSSTAGLTFTWNGTSSTGTTFTNPKNSGSIYCGVTNSTGCTSYFYWYAKPIFDACDRTIGYDYTKARFCQQNLAPYTGCEDGTSSNLRKETSDNNSTNQFNVYPNPANDKISFVTNGSNGSAIIYDIDGIALKTQALTEGRTMYDMDITEIPSGVYFLHVTSSTGKVDTAPIVKQ